MNYIKNTLKSSQIQTSRKNAVLVMMRRFSNVHLFVRKAVVVWLFITSMLVSMATFAGNTFPVVKHSDVWQSLIKDMPKEKGIFNRALRESVREALPLAELSNIEAVDTEFIQQKLNTRLQALDQALQKYVRVSESLNSYQQLEKLMPALFVIEEYKLITDLYKQQKVRLPTLRNKRLLRFIDQRIKQLASHLIFNMKTLVRERRPYEEQLLKAMTSYGVEYSAKPPDFILEYDIAFENINENSEWVFNTHIALLNQYQLPIVSVDELIVTAAEDKEKARQIALEVMAKLITMQLRLALINKQIDL